MKFSKIAPFSRLAVLAFASLSIGLNAQVSLSPSDTAVTDNLSPANVNTTAITSGVNSVVTGDFPIRERSNAAQNNRRISSYLKFDLSDAAVVSALAAPPYTASLTLEYVGQLNTLNGGMASVGRVTTADWDSTANFPLHSYGLESGVGTNAASVIDFLAVATTPATGDTLTIDVTTIVADWVNGTPNYGFVLFFNQNVSQGAGFNNPQLVITAALDTDGDGMPDEYETANNLDPNVDDAAADNDADGGTDGLTNLEEYTAGTNPQDADSDDDGLLDGQEVNGTLNPYQTDVAGDAATVAPGLRTDPLVPDSDLDGLTDFEELNGVVITNPNTIDTDGDLLSDTYELASELDPTDPTGDNGGAGDPDMDLLTTVEEQAAGTDPNNADSDGDDLKDGEEVNTYMTEPLNPDTDGDHLTDGEEVDGGLTSPIVADADMDEFLDGVEVAAGSDPNDFSSTPTMADISWSVEALDEEADLLTNGSLLYAENLNGPQVTANGIPFASAIDLVGVKGTSNVLTQTINNAGGDFFYLDEVPELSPLLENIWTGGTDRTVSIFGLTSGKTYAVQVGRADDRDTGTIVGRYLVIDGFGGEDATEPVGSENTVFGGSTNPALLFTGNFTATGSVQSFEVEQFLPGGITPSTVINFIQVRELDPRSIKITAISVDRTNGMVTLTWESEETDRFSAFYSVDMRDNFVGELDDGIPAGPGTTTTETFDLSGAGLQNVERVFFRIRLDPPPAN